MRYVCNNYISCFCQSSELLYATKSPTGITKLVKRAPSNNHNFIIKRLQSRFDFNEISITYYCYLIMMLRHNDARCMIKLLLLDARYISSLRGAWGLFYMFYEKYSSTPTTYSLFTSFCRSKLGRPASAL